MGKLKVTYHNGDTEIVSSELTPEQYFESRFGHHSEEVREKTKVVEHKEKTEKAKLSEK